MRMRVKESTIVAKIAAALRARGGYVVKLHGGPLQQAGLPDLLCISRGRALFIEVKRPGEQPTALQAHVLRQLAGAGAVAVVAASVGEALEYLSEWLVDARDRQRGGVPLGSIVYEPPWAVKVEQYVGMLRKHLRDGNFVQCHEVVSCAQREKADDGEAAAAEQRMLDSLNVDAWTRGKIARSTVQTIAHLLTLSPSEIRHEFGDRGAARVIEAIVDLGIGIPENLAIAFSGDSGKRRGGCWRAAARGKGNPKRRH